MKRLFVTAFQLLIVFIVSAQTVNERLSFKCIIDDKFGEKIINETNCIVYNGDAFIVKKGTQVITVYKIIGKEEKQSDGGVVGHFEDDKGKKGTYVMSSTKKELVLLSFYYRDEKGNRYTIHYLFEER